MRKFDAVIFDMDGLMVDTERIMKEQIKEILKEMGFPATEQSILKLIGLTDSRTKEVLEKEYGKEFRHDIFLKKLLERKQNVYHNEQINVKKGVWELLEFLKISFFLRKKTLQNAVGVHFQECAVKKF